MQFVLSMDKQNQRLMYGWLPKEEEKVLKDYAFA